MGRPCKDQRETPVNELTALFSGVSADEINEVVASIKTRLTSAKKAKNRKRLNAFDKHVQTLLDKGYPDAAGMKNDQFFGYINPLRDKFEIGDIIVIPERIVSIPKQMSMVKLNGETGYTYLNLGVLRQADGVETPNVPYLIRNVENGAAMRGIAPNNCVERFKKRGRFGLTTEEGIAIVTHNAEMLYDLNIELPGSCYQSDHVPILWLRVGNPDLGCNVACGAKSGWGSASCGSR